MYFVVGLVADEYLDLEVVAGGVEIVERSEFGGYLEVVVFKEDVFGLEALFLELESGVGRSAKLIEFTIHT